MYIFFKLRQNNQNNCKKKSLNFVQILNCIEIEILRIIYKSNLNQLNFSIDI